MIEAINYYYERVMRIQEDPYLETREKKTLQYVSTEDMDAIEERIRYAAKEEARQEANKEVMTMVGSMLAAIQAGGGACNASNK